MAKEKEIINVEEVSAPVHWQWIKGDESGNGLHLMKVVG